jgi:hypothetical protein
VVVLVADMPSARSARFILFDSFFALL